LATGLKGIDGSPLLILSASYSKAKLCQIVAICAFKYDSLILLSLLILLFAH